MSTRGSYDVPPVVPLIGDSARVDHEQHDQKDDQDGGTVTLLTASPSHTYSASSMG